MYSRLSAFLDKYDVLYSNQFGFRRGRSTDDAVLQFTDEVYNAFNKNKYLMAVMLDLSNAFDAVQSDILLGKLECIGVRGVPLEWFRSYLTCRKQFVSENNENSSVRDIAFGVPQDSVLAPLLFLIYINDMHVCSGLLGMIHFADDTTVYTTGDNFDAILTMLNIELEKIDHNDCSLYFDGRLNEVQLLHTYSTRHSVSGRLNLPVTSKSRCGDSFFTQAIKAWNELPQSIRETGNVFKYKRLIKSHLFLTM